MKVGDRVQLVSLPSDAEVGIGGNVIGNKGVVFGFEYNTDYPIVVKWDSGEENVYPGRCLSIIEDEPSESKHQTFNTLSKAEYARIHAPDVPKWFVQQFGIKIGSGRICTNQTHKAWLDYFVSVTVD